MTEIPEVLITIAVIMWTVFGALAGVARYDKTKSTGAATVSFFLWWLEAALSVPDSFRAWLESVRDDHTTEG